MRFCLAVVYCGSAYFASSFTDLMPKGEPYRVHTSVLYTNCLVPRLDLIIGSSYYWGVMDRYEAEGLLDNKPEGKFSSVKLIF